MEHLEHRILSIVAIHGPIQAQDVLEILANSDEVYEADGMDLPVSMEEVTRILNDAVEYELLVKDEKGFRFP